ncbi:hypothetical protein LCGC14_1259150 [marine sediment metagenome]|uniref:Replication initiation protein-like C-terminal domain-containing protein n=1 Tax=marine sediment metagenome TaxID=412755 RepID=A0A0F9NHX0_9ZZZZ
MELSAGIDWISVTFPALFPGRWRSCIHPADTETKRQIKPRNGYSQATVYASGATQSTNDSRPDMGIHIVYSARAIGNMETMYGVDQKQLLQHLTNGSKMTRLDVRIDVFDSGLDIEKLYQMARSGQVETKARTIGFTESATTGSERGAATCYIGSQKKRKKLLRVYDKGSQLGLLVDLKRFELELHSGATPEAVKRLKTANLGDWGEHIGGLIKGYCYWPDDNAVADIFADMSKIKIAVPEEDTGNTIKWLLNVVAPVLAREAAMDSSLIVEFMHRVMEELDARDAIDNRGAGQ